MDFKPNSKKAVAQCPRSGRWYIQMAYAGFNSPANNGFGYDSELAAKHAHLRYANKGRASRGEPLLKLKDLQ